jgi:Na+-translocating ferredoxin:NAD+ oxidoreductase RnfC subunit
MSSADSENLVQAVRDAGVVGAGGAGFPTYKKIDTKADIVIANGAECEPLLYKDQALMEHHAAEIVDGLRQVMRRVGATRGIVAIKGKNRTAIESLTPHVPDEVEIFKMEDVYPAGDEYEVVFHATGRRIPPGGYPTEIGVLVQNVETLFNVERATRDFPVTHSMMTVHGHVLRPFTAWLPIGMSYGDVLELAGGATIDDFVMIDGGPMMGTATTDLSTQVTRVSSGITVLARDSTLGVRKAQDESALKRFGKSACDQCCLCTEMCPRYLLGYPIQPHLVMRSLLVSGEMNDTLTHWAQPCSECNICSLWACPEGLDPRGVCVAAKTALRERGDWLSAEQLRRLTKEVHRLKTYRAVPTARLTRRLGLSEFTDQAPLESCEKEPESVAIPLQQHVGVPAVPVVAEGNQVNVGDVLARAADAGLSVPIHASIDGTVASVSDRIVIRR